MKKLLQGFALPFTLFSSIIMMMGCEPTFKSSADEASKDQDTSGSESVETQHEVTPKADLKSGNFFYIARDVADLQLNAGNYITELKQSQNNVQQAIESKNQQLLQSSASSLQKQLQGFNQALINLDLQSQEINNIRENIVAANTQVLKSPLMNGAVDFNKVDFSQLQQQLSSVQNEMLKLAAMMIPKGDSNQTSDSESSE